MIESLGISKCHFFIIGITTWIMSRIKQIKVNLPFDISVDQLMLLGKKVAQWLLALHFLDSTYTSALSAIVWIRKPKNFSIHFIIHRHMHPRYTFSFIRLVPYNPFMTYLHVASAFSSTCKWWDWFWNAPRVFQYMEYGCKVAFICIADTYDKWTNEKYYDLTYYASPEIEKSSIIVWSFCL